MAAASDATAAPPSPSPPLHVAIVGGGIAGVSLALGLQIRGVSFTLYERAPAIGEVGAGIGLSPNAERAMLLLDREPGGASGPVHGAYKRACTPNGLDYFQWVDGLETDEVRYKLYMGEDAFQGCRRSDLVEAMVASISPADRIQLGKQAVSIREEEEGKPVEITFADGTTAHADVVVGCDGIRSNVRRVMFGADNPVSHPCYSGMFCFRTLVPMAAARAALGHERTHTRYMYNGPGAHAITYPVGHGESLALNVLVVLSDPNGTAGWDLEATGGRQTAPGTREEAQRAVEAFHPTFKAVVDLLPETPEKWAIFDSLDNPAPTYARGAVCLAGDAAHATGPHLGAGAGFGIEDALALATLLEAVDKHRGTSGGGSGGEGRAEVVARALRAYDEARRERTQWLVGATREAVDLFHWDHTGMSQDEHWARFETEITSRFYKIWEYDLEGMMAQALEKLGLPGSS